MAFTRSFLKTLGLNEEQVQAVVDAHLEVVNPLKDERDSLKEAAAKAGDLQREIDTLKSGEDFKAKYDTEHKAFEDYKATVAAEAKKAEVQAAYRKLLIEEKINEKRLDAVIRLTDFNSMKLDKDGNLVDADKLRENIKHEWGEYITETQVRGANVQTPPNVGNATMTRADIYARDEHGRYKLSTEERQKAIAENPQAFK